MERPLLQQRARVRVHGKKHQLHSQNNYLSHNNNIKDHTLKLPDWIYGYIIVGLLSFVVYWNNIGGDFVHDDVRAIRNNADVTGETTLGKLLSNDFWGKSMADPASHKSYRPLCVLTFRLNYILEQLDPSGYHLTNNVLHCVVSLLFTWFCQKIIFSGCSRLATAAGVLFAVHPVHTEAVSGLVGRADILACLFFLLAALSYHQCLRKGCPTSTNRRWLFCSVLCAGLSLLCKENGITVLGVCILYEAFMVLHTSRHTLNARQHFLKISSSSAFRAAVLILAALLFLTFRFCLNGGQLPRFQEEDSPASFAPYWLTRVLSYGYIWTVGAWLMLCPVTLSHDWQMGSIPLVTSLWDSRNLASLCLILLLMGSCYVVCCCDNNNKYQNVMKRRVFYGLVLTVVPYLPACHVFIRVGFVIAERILYIPSMGVIILVVQGTDMLSQLLPRYKDKIKSVFLIYLTLFYSSRTVMRNRVWLSRHSLASSGIQVLPQNAKVHYNYANVLADGQQVDLAITHYKEAIRLWPTYASAHNNLATHLSNTTEALYHLSEAVRLHPCHSNAYTNMANIYHRNLNDTETAQSLLEKAYACNDMNPQPHLTQAVIYQQQGLLGQARSHLLKALALAPLQHDVHHNLAAFYESSGEIDLAIQHIEKALSLEPDNAQSLRLLLRFYRTHSQYTEPQKFIDRALEKSSDPLLLDIAGTFFSHSGETKKALSLLRKAYNIHHTEDIILHMGQLMSQLELYHEAEVVLTHTLHQYNRSVQLHIQLANVYGLQNQHGKAYKLLEAFLTRHNTSIKPEEKSALYHHTANHLKDMGQLDLAAQYFNLAVGIDPQNADCHHNLAVYYHKLKQNHLAMYHYRAAISLEPDDTLLQSNYQRLLNALLTDHSNKHPAKTDTVSLESEKIPAKMDVIQHPDPLPNVTYHPSKTKTTVDSGRILRTLDMQDIDEHTPYHLLGGGK